MPIRRSRIALLIAGGTVLPGTPRLRRGVTRAGEARLWLDDLAELHMLAEVEPIFVLAEDSLLPAERWKKIARAIQAVPHTFDGIVVLHEPATAPLTAVAIAALVRTTPRTIAIAAGSNEGQTGGRSNLINAVQTATAGIAHVVYLRGPQIIAASDAMNPVIEESALIGRIDFGVRLVRAIPKQSSPRAIIQTVLEPKVVVVAADVLWASGWTCPTGTKGVVITWPPDSAMMPKTAVMNAQTNFAPGVPVVAAGWPNNEVVPRGWVSTELPGAAAMARLMVALGDPKRSWSSVFGGRRAKR